MGNRDEVKLRAGLPPLPDRIKKLPIDPRGYPIPWFVAEVNGKRDFRIADEKKRYMAVKQHLCWICGEKLGRHLAFVLGPMCVVNRNTSEPPCHRDCAEFAVKACPFLILPKAQYRDANLPEGHRTPPNMLPGNPGGVAIWMTTSFLPYRVSRSGDWLIEVGPASDDVSWYVQGRLATRAEVKDLLNARLHLLAVTAAAEGPEATAELEKRVLEANKLIPER